MPRCGGRLPSDPTAHRGDYRVTSDHIATTFFCLITELAFEARRSQKKCVLHPEGTTNPANHLGLNKATILLLRRGAGLQENRTAAAAVGDSLDHMIGKWSEEEEKELLETIQAFE
jgi:hypothetical protein